MACPLALLTVLPKQLRVEVAFCGQLANADELHHNRHAWYCAAQLNICKIARVDADLFGQLPVGHFHSFTRLLNICSEGFKSRAIFYIWHITSPYAPRTIVSRLTTVNGFLASAGRPDLRYLPEKVEPAPPRCPTWEEYLSALDAARRQGRRMSWLLMRVFGEMQLPQHALGELTVRAVRAGTLRATVNGRERVFAVPPRLQRELLDYAAARGIKNGPIFVSRSGSPIARNRIALELQQGAGGLQSRVDMTSSRSLNHVRARPGAAIPGWADAS